MLPSQLNIYSIFNNIAAIGVRSQRELIFSHANENILYKFQERNETFGCKNHKQDPLFVY